MNKKILFICTANKLRSRTAEDLLKKDYNFEVKSAGTSLDAVKPITRELLEWADNIYVMERRHRNIIHERFPDIYENKRIECLYIPDEYDYMDPGLVELLRNRFLKYFNTMSKETFEE